LQDYLPVKPDFLSEDI